MNRARLEQLLEFLKEDPNDPFHWYAIGNEYRATDPQKAKEYFLELRSRFPSYLPTYYILAEVLAEEGAVEETEEVYKQGIAMAEEQQSLKTLAELKNAYQNFLFELD